MATDVSAAIHQAGSNLCAPDINPDYKPLLHQKLLFALFFLN
jgi:hypothetical protein